MIELCSGYMNGIKIGDYMKFQCFKDIMIDKGYMRIRQDKESMYLYIEVKTEKSKETIENIVNNDDDVWFVYNTWHEQGWGYGISIYDINYIETILKKAEEKNAKKYYGKLQEDFYVQMSVGKKSREIINKKLAERNSDYEINMNYDRVYNKKIVQQKKEAKEKEEQEIDNFLDCLIGD